MIIEVETRSSLERVLKEVPLAQQYDCFRWKLVQSITRSF